MAVYAHGINAPKDVTVHGDEVFERVQREKAEEGRLW